MLSAQRIAAASISSPAFERGPPPLIFGGSRRRKLPSAGGGVDPVLITNLCILIRIERISEDHRPFLLPGCLGREPRPGNAVKILHQLLRLRCHAREDPPP